MNRSRVEVADVWNMRLVGHTDLNGHGDGMHVNLKDGYAYVGHMGESRVGTSVVDVSDPEQPRVVCQLMTPPGTHSHKVQVVGDVLVVNHERNTREHSAPSWSSGLQLYDVSRPDNPRELGFLPVNGNGVHRVTYVEEPYAYMSATDDGFTDQFLLIADLSDPARPREVSRWWFPGMNAGAGEKPTWDTARRSFKHHHALVRGDRAYASWWDAGLVILDISDRSRPEIVSWLDFGEGASSCTHTTLPIPGRELLVVTDESTKDECQEGPKRVRVVDIGDETRPRVISTFPVPEGDFCSRGGRFGPHNLHEMRPGTFVSSDIVFVTYFNAGLRVVDISDPTDPTEVAYCVPAAPAGQRAIQLNDVLVGPDGLIYVTDRYRGGLYLLERT
jgi:hypothetical protein